MPEWLGEALRDALQLGEGLTPSVVVARLAWSLLLGFVVAGVYRLTVGGRKDDPATLPATLVLLAVLVALVTLVIGGSLARAFGLVGALSIVRFRTVVEDTRDTAFVIFAVAVGMGAGAGYPLIALAGVPPAAAAAAVMRALARRGAAGGAVAAVLAVRVGLGHAPDELLGAVFGKHLHEARLVAAATARQGAALELTYAVRLRPDAMVALVTELNRTEGVQNAELRQTL